MRGLGILCVTPSTSMFHGIACVNYGLCVGWVQLAVNLIVVKKEKSLGKHYKM